MAAKKKKKLAPTKRGVPAYMTSFADMMTLMLTFFILLVAFAQEQRAELVAAGTGSFINAIDSLGLPGFLPGGRRPVALGQVPPSFTIPTQHVERAAALLNRDLETAPPDRLRRSTIEYLLRHKQAVVLAASVTFSLLSGAELDERCRTQLDAVAAMAQQNRSYVAVEAHVGGLGDGWELSALRAAAVAQYLREKGLIPYQRIALAGYGSFQPLADRTTEGRSSERVNILLSAKPLD